MRTSIYSRIYPSGNGHRAFLATLHSPRVLQRPKSSVNGLLMGIKDGVQSPFLASAGVGL